MTEQEAHIPLGEFLSGNRVKFFTMRRIKHWRSFSREVVGSPLLEVFRTCLDRAQDNLIEGPAFNQRLEGMTSRGFVQPRLFYDFYNLNVWLVS